MAAESPVTGASTRVRSGSPARLLRLCATYHLNAPGAARALVRRHPPIREAKTVAERLFDEGHAIVEIPAVESLDALRIEFEGCKVEAQVLLPME
jgi:hypothetical protein